LPMAVHPDPAIKASSFDLQLNALIDRKRSLSQDLFFPPEGDDGDLNELFRQVALSPEEANSDGPSAVAETSQVGANNPEARPSSPLQAVETNEPQPRKVLSLPSVAKDAGAKVWIKRSGEARPTAEILALFAGKSIQQVTIKDPYCLANSRTRAAQVEFLRLLASVARSLDNVAIHYSADIDAYEDDGQQRRDIASQLLSAFPNGCPKLSLMRRHHRQEKHDDFHDRFVEVDVKSAAGALFRHTLTIGRGLEAMFDDRKACTIAYAPPSAS